MQMTRLYQDRIQPLLSKAGGVDVIDSKSGARIKYPGVATGRR